MWGNPQKNKKNHIFGVVTRGCNEAEKSKLSKVTCSAYTKFTYLISRGKGGGRYARKKFNKLKK